MPVWGRGCPWLSILLIVGVFSGGPGLGQVLVASSEPAELLWTGGYRLSWQDFLGDPPPASLRGTEAARIWVGIRYFASWELSFDPVRGRWTARLLDCTTQAFMDRTRSWALPDQRLPEVLRHEQGHFDLLEVFRRLLEQELMLWIGKPVSATTREEAERKLTRLLEEVYLRVWEAHEACQAQYDQETEHGGNQAQQDLWSRRIALWLEGPLPTLP